LPAVAEACRSRTAQRRVRECGESSPQHAKVAAGQLNGGEFAQVEECDWALLTPVLEENERLFGIPVARLLDVNGTALPPAKVYRKIRPGAMAALHSEEAWVKMHV
jgi:hypothetical protein